MRNITTIHMASDHAGFEMKEELKAWLEAEGYTIEDHGAYEYEETDDYPDYCGPAARAVAMDPESVGIILGGSGQGEMIVANRVPGVRAMLFNGQFDRGDGSEIPNEVILSRQHNDSNMISLGSRFINTNEAKEAIETWLETEFPGEERHIRRINKIDSMRFE